jgi:RimJ/RimL family protein N-acetyltransferase
VRTIDEARDYIESRFTASYQKFGFGMWAVELKERDALAGICGFVKRDSLPEVDIGFAFLSQFERKGYAFESASAAMCYGADVLKLPCVLAITSKDNASSQKLLQKIGLKFERLISLPGDAEELKLFSSDS